MTLRAAESALASQASELDRTLAEARLQHAKARRYFEELDQQVAALRALDERNVATVLRLQAERTQLEAELSSQAAELAAAAELDASLQNLRETAKHRQDDLRRAQTAQQCGDAEEYRTQLSECHTTHKRLEREKQILLDHLAALDDAAQALKNRLVRVVQREQRDSFRIMTQFKYRAPHAE